VTGQRTFDFNTDGLAHIGLMPDLIADLALLNTNLDPLMRSAAGYVTAWRKAVAASAAQAPQQKTLPTKVVPKELPTKPIELNPKILAPASPIKKKP
jgi:hypothetical protein